MYKIRLHYKRELSINHSCKNISYIKMKNAKFTLEHVMKGQREGEVKLYSFFNLDSRMCGRLSTRPGCFSSESDPLYSGACLRHCATSRRVSGSIPGGVAGDFFRSYRRNHVPWGRLSL
jgi:hypothetical protein